MTSRKHKYSNTGLVMCKQRIIMPDYKFDILVSADRIQKLLENNRRDELVENLVIHYQLHYITNERTTFN